MLGRPEASPGRRRPTELPLPHRDPLRRCAGFSLVLGTWVRGAGVRRNPIARRAEIHPEAGIEADPGAVPRAAANAAARTERAVSSRGPHDAPGPHAPERPVTELPDRRRGLAARRACAGRIGTARGARR